MTGKTSWVVQHQSPAWRPPGMDNVYPMKRRSWLTAVLALAATGVVAPSALAACGRAGNSASPANSGPAAGFELVRSTRSRAAADPKAQALAVNAVQDFGAAAFRVLAGKPGNLAVSPASIHLALAMALLGAKGTTASEMLGVLHAPDAATLARGLNTLATTLHQRAGTVDLGGGQTATIDLEIADGLWGQQGVSWAPAFLDALAAQFGAGMRVVDFATRTEQARLAINDWVSDVTRSTIPELLAPGVLSSVTRLALVNALYLKAPWARPFEKRDTTEGDFTRSGASRVRVPFMRADQSMPYAAGSGWQAVRLEYAGGKLAMTLILPDAGRSASVATSLDGDRLRAVLAAPQPAQVRLALPRWRTRTSVMLEGMLSSLGLRTAFTDAADFTGMTTSATPLTIGAVAHQGYVSVDEAGTEASAATAVVMNLTSAMAELRSVAFDRPFLYVIHDVETSAPLFIGRVADPTAG